jgi:hypothetical protein
MAKTLPEAMAANSQVKEIIAFIKLLEKLNDIQKARLEGVAIGMTMDKPA